MKSGLTLMGYGGCWDDAASTEQHGLATAGFVNSPLLGGDPVVGLGLAAQTARRTRIGIFVAVPSNRTAATPAAALATVNRIARGRLQLMPVVNAAPSPNPASTRTDRRQ